MPDNWPNAGTSLVETNTEASANPRVRIIVDEYRVVFTNGTQKGSKFYTNNSFAIIEIKSKDATGQEKWDRVTAIQKPGAIDANERDEDAINRALYWLLAGPGAG